MLFACVSGGVVSEKLAWGARNRCLDGLPPGDHLPLRDRCLGSGTFTSMTVSLFSIGQARSLTAARTVLGWLPPGVRGDDAGLQTFPFPYDLGKVRSQARG